MENQCFVSIIVPIYNSSPFLEQTLLALQAQTMERLEIILIDDGSTDDSPSICKKFVQADPRFFYYRKENAGVSAARNDGIRHAKGQWLMFCDSDDLPFPQMAQRLFEKAMDTNADCVLCDFQIQTERDTVSDRLEMPHDLEKPDDILEHLILPMCVWGYGEKSVYGSVWRGLYRTERLHLDGEPLQFPEGICFGEDLLFNIQVWRACRRISFVPEILYTYVDNTNSAVHTNYSLRWERSKLLWQRASELLQAVDLTEEQRRWHSFQLTRYAVDSILFGVCTAECPSYQKWRLTAKILSASELKAARCQIPHSLSLKDKVLLFFLKPIFAPIVTRYYQGTIK